MKSPDKHLPRPLARAVQLLAAAALVWIGAEEIALCVVIVP